VTAPVHDAAEVVVARQPILDRDEAVIGYELLVQRLLRASGDRPRHDATARVLVQSLAEVGLERVAGDRPALRVRPLPLPPERIVIELRRWNGAAAPKTGTAVAAFCPARRRRGAG
jgi:EAL and modified HD-GYP domain-containing signal transduction protein